ncbi:MAG: SDR family NAD(P)-dependent oxidoreductase [Akkermansiaceae bacterium]|nr:SDR family NAD(P)-dependent oxidoreductase [Verrucomicrobiae bacterium]MCP5555357.1 SDR family NAD(P)-dependent oxidoreductase [Akkermansiaceae bacterium]
MKTILLTGAAGFIGSHTARHLLDDGWQVVGIDNLNDYYDPRLKEHRISELQKREGFVFRPLDIEDLAGLESLFKEFRFESVINLAARAGVRYSMVNPHVYMTTNAHGSLNLLELMRQHGCRKFVLASTSSLYAGHDMPFTEDMPVNRPISPYASSKKAAECMAFTYHHLYGIDATVVRYFTVYGPAGRPDMSPYRFIKWIAEGTPITMFGDGLQSRDFTYVDDIARGTVAALRPVGYEIVNLGGGREPTNMLELIRLMEDRLGRKAVIDFQPTNNADMRDTQADPSKAQSLWGWEARVGLEEGLDRTIAWYRENADLVRDLPV